MTYIHTDLADQIQHLKDTNKYAQALKLVNSILVSDPVNTDALMHIADINYRQGELTMASKPIDFLLHQDPNDPMTLYTKGILEMEKTHRAEAKKYLQKAIEITKFEHAEIVRAYGVCDFRYGNREKGIDFLHHALELAPLDAEIITDLVHCYVIQHKYQSAGKYIKYFNNKHTKLQTFDKKIDYYDEKITLYHSFIQTL